MSFFLLLTEKAVHSWASYIALVKSAGDPLKCRFWFVSGVGPECAFRGHSPPFVLGLVLALLSFQHLEVQPKQKSLVLLFTFGVPNINKLEPISKASWFNVRIWTYCF